jgi:hypothetical protein
MPNNPDRGNQQPVSQDKRKRQQLNDKDDASPLRTEQDAPLTRFHEHARL